MPYLLPIKDDPDLQAKAKRAAVAKMACKLADAETSPEEKARLKSVAKLKQEEADWELNYAELA